MLTQLSKVTHFISISIGLVSLVFSVNQSEFINPGDDIDDSLLFNIAHADVPSSDSSGGDSSGCCGACGAGSCGSGGCDAGSADSGCY